MSLNGTGQTLTISSGTASLSQANTYTGATTVSGGTLALVSPGSLGNTAVSVTATAGTISINGNYSIGTASAGTASLTIGGSTTGGTLTFLNSESALSTLTINNATPTNTAITLGGSTSGAAVLNFNYNASGPAEHHHHRCEACHGCGRRQHTVESVGPERGDSLAAGTYSLLSYASTTRHRACFTLGSLVNGPAGDVAYLNATTTAEQLVVTGGAPAAMSSGTAA